MSPLAAVVSPVVVHRVAVLVLGLCGRLAADCSAKRRSSVTMLESIQEVSLVVCLLPYDQPPALCWRLVRFFKHAGGMAATRVRRNQIVSFGCHTGNKYALYLLLSQAH